MKSFLKNSITIISEVLILGLSILWYYKTKEIEPIVGIIASSAFLIGSVISFFPSKDEITKAGNHDLKYLDPNFLNNYIPEKVSINKIIEDLGQPTLKFSYSSDQEEDNIIYYDIYKYKFYNAIIWIATQIGNDIVISISLIPKLEGSHAAICRYSYAEDDKPFGKANFTQNIIQNSVEFESKSFPQWGYSSITSRYVDYRPIKYLYFTYWNYNYYENELQLIDKKIEGICVSAISNLHPIIHFDEFFYN